MHLSCFLLPFYMTSPHLPDKKHNEIKGIILIDGIEASKYEFGASLTEDARRECVFGHTRNLYRICILVIFS